MKKTDIMIIGGGIAGLTAAIYTSRAGLKTIVLENNSAGGQITTSAKIENYPGFEEISGAELSSKVLSQAVRCGAVFDEFDPISEVNLNDRTVKTKNELYQCGVIIIASGASPKKLEAGGADELEGKFIHYCAACDGAFYKNKRTIVVGGGNSAAEGAIFLSDIAESVVMIVRGDALKAEKTYVSEIERRKNIEVKFHAEIAKVDHNNECIITAKDGNVIKADGIFVFIGSRASTELVSAQLETDSQGYIVCDDEMQTSMPGVFAVGDVRQKKVRQLTTAASDGTIAAFSAQRFLFNYRQNQMKKENGEIK